MYKFLTEIQAGDLTLKVCIVVGELSGDLLAADLILELKRLYSKDLSITGIIGPHLSALGAKQIFSMKHLSIMGFIDPLLSLPKLLYIRSKLFKEILKIKPDLFIGVDAPEFNLGLEKQLKKHHIKTVHYVSPSVWAWRSNRIYLIKKAVDLMLTLFPFEVDFYKRHKVNAVCVGHPLADRIPMVSDPKIAKQKLGFKEHTKILTMMPGSRDSELRHLAKIYIQTAKEISLRFPYIKFVIPVVSEKHKDYINQILRKIAPKLSITIIVNNSYTAIEAADLVLVTSGTATLEIMLHKKPMVVAYKTNSLTYWIAKRLIKVNYIALPNLLNNGLIVKEFIQNKVTVYNLTNALSEIINLGGITTKQQLVFDQLHEELRKNASMVAADEIMKLLPCS